MSFALFLLVSFMLSVAAFESGDLLKILLGRHIFYVRCSNKVGQFSELWSTQSSNQREVYVGDKYRYGAGHRVSEVYVGDKYRYGAGRGVCDVSLIIIISLLFIIGFICVEVKMTRCLLSVYTQYKKSKDNLGNDFHQILKELHLNKRQEILTYPSSLKSYFKQRLEDRAKSNHLMKYEWSRYESFKDFPSTSPARPTRLASSGFYYVGCQDTVKCFVCNLEVNDWRPDDIPLDVHRQRSPHCPFLNGGVTGNIAIHDQLEDDNNRPLIESDGLDAASEIGRSVVDSRHRDAGHNEIRNELVPDSHLDSHVANNESPASLITQNEHVRIDRDTEFHDLNIDQDDIYTEENNKLAQRITCKICLDRNSNVVFLPCGHVVSCDACAAMLRKCAVCRSPIKGRVRTQV